MRPARRILLVLLVAIISCQTLLATGTDTPSYTSVKTLREKGVAGGDVLVDTLTSLASVMDHVTRVMAYQLSPFPSVMQWFDGGKAYDGARTTASGGLASSSTDDGEKTRWNLVSSLFVILLVCESIWTAIRAYFNKDDDTLKFLFTDIVTCVVLYLLCAAVPFIVQASVFGFQRMAYVMSTGSMDMGADEVASSQIYPRSPAARSTACPATSSGKAATCSTSSTPEAFPTPTTGRSTRCRTRTGMASSGSSTTGSRECSNEERSG